MPLRPNRAKTGWLNRSTIGAGAASLFSDVSHELATAVLPAFLLSLGAGPAALGWIEGAADGLSSVAKLWGGVVADRVARRKPIASIGYHVVLEGEPEEKLLFPLLDEGAGGAAARGEQIESRRGIELTGAREHFLPEMVATSE